MRLDNRQNSDLRAVSIEVGVNRYAEGSALVKYGNTHVMCTASVELTVPKWLQGSGKGWVTADYGMLPRSTHDRMNREKIASSGRTMEIARLISRSLRSGVDLYKIPDKQISVDCDVLQADGGTRTAAITGSFVALTQALMYLHKKNEIKEMPIKHLISATSVGIVNGAAMLDLAYAEDSGAETDANFVMTSDNMFVEIQGTAEDKPFSQQQLQMMLELASQGCAQLFQVQRNAMKSFGYEGK